MRKLSAFNNISLDGFFAAPDGDISWAHAGGDEPEFAAFIANNAQRGGALVLGRVTYDMMAGYWPTPAATRGNPIVAQRMNAMRKIVPSRSKESLDWVNTVLVKGEFAAEIRRLKAEDGAAMTILGSGSIVSQLSNEGLIDEYQVVVNPVVLGAGRTMFEGVTRRFTLRLTESRSFANGKLFLRYESGD